ncbi:nickel ABC transporter ATP-binding protein NikE [Nocardia sp. NPDC051570]|uniref:nickel ABC transporter ATP-binding protein NikE n=1 Tax=Nocardia sp. NPDC051570 TaxID=3364324 RepID=UPI0037B7B194
MPTETLLTIRDLHVDYGAGWRTTQAVRGVDLIVAPGEVVALVGESGSGKSTIALSTLGLLPPTASVRTAELSFAGTELTALSNERMRDLRGLRLGLVPQDASMSLNPVQRIGDQVAEVLRIHDVVPSRAAAGRAVELLAETGLPDPLVLARRFPHQLSAGMHQRVLLAIAMAARPRLLVADEPTSALDVITQRLVLDRIGELTRTRGTAVLLVTHDLAVAADRADRIVVLSAGRVVEQGSAAEVLTAPREHYTRVLVASVPGMTSTRLREPSLPADAVELLRVDGLVKEFPLPGGGLQRVVDGIDLSLCRGETLALVGESGSGKSTTGRLVLGLERPTSGVIAVDGERVDDLPGRRRRTLRRRMQLVYQDARAALDPRMSIADIVAEPLRAFRVGTRGERRERVAELLDHVQLSCDVMSRRPAELSGGQRQRVVIARALALRPDLLVCDEPVSALDVTVQAHILELLARLQSEFGLGCLFITHDLAVARQISDRIAVLRRGRLVETGATEDVLEHPQHPYTAELVDAIPGQRWASDIDITERSTDERV